MLKKLGVAFTAAVLAFATAAPITAQTYSPFEQCLIDHCFGYYQNDPVGYRMCRDWCARQTGGPQFAPPAVDPGKLD